MSLTKCRSDYIKTKVHSIKCHKIIIKIATECTKKTKIVITNWRTSEYNSQC